MVAAFPLVKIGLLLLKQLSKPLANFLKNEAKKHPVIRKYVILPTGRASQQIERLLSPRGQVPRLSEEEAVELGANTIGEVVLFGFLTIILIAEINRQGDKKAMKQKSKDDEFANLVEVVIEVVKDVDSLKKSVSEVRRTLEIAHDVIALEEQRHASNVPDYDFLEITTITDKKEENLDLDTTL